MRAIFRKDADAAVPDDINTDLGGGPGTADNTTDSNEAIRDRGDAAWTTGSGGGGGTTANFDNTKIVQSRVLKIGSRHDNVYTAWPKARFVQGEVTPYWIDMSRFVGPDPIYDIEDATASDGSVTISSTGVNRDLVVIWPVTAAADPGEYTINVEVHPHPGETVIVEATIEVVSPIV
jgi:hypothetical protein